VGSPETRNPLIYWFREDLRLADSPALTAAATSGRPVIACYIHDEESPGEWAPGAASRWWLHHSLHALSLSLRSLGGDLLLLSGSAVPTLLKLADDTGAAAIYCTRAHQPWASTLETELHHCCTEAAIEFRRFPGALLYEPEKVSTAEGKPYKVFTPFWRACGHLPEPAPPVGAPEAIEFPEYLPAGLNLEDLELLPTAPDWAAHWLDLWQPGEKGALERLNQFLAGTVAGYIEGRNHPAENATSRLSAHLRFGELSPRQVWHRARYVRAQKPASADHIDKFLSELGWREFSHHLLHHFPQLPEQPFKARFGQFPWAGQAQALQAWQRGQTGYPIVDAGMRELWHTGFMHNRVRMIVASFLTKHLLIHWRAGENWFWDTLVDADLANNACGWQWVAGSGADAAPYFRIFNPTLQGQKFDSRGDYVRRWVPELASLPDRYLHQPHTAPVQVLTTAGIRIGVDYPAPFIDHRYAREAALSAYNSIKG
jgi:deoxyribodipyrimidine photo-lyase